LGSACLEGIVLILLKNSQIFKLLYN